MEDSNNYVGEGYFDEVIDELRAQIYELQDKVTELLSNDVTK